MKIWQDERTECLLSFIRENGINLNASEVVEQAEGDVLGHPYFTQVIVRRGYVANNRYAFDQYHDTEEYHEKVECDEPSVQECIATIKTSDGKVPLAHPYQIGIRACFEKAGKLCEINKIAIEAR